MGWRSWLFGEDDDDVVEEKHDIVDPMVEERLKEKFSSPLIYDDFDEKQEEVKKEKKKEVKSANVAKPVTTKSEPYIMHDIISPIYGVQQQKPVKKTVSKAPSKKKVIKKSDELVQVMSPFFGPANEEDKKKTKFSEKIKETIHKEETIEKKPQEEAAETKTSEPPVVEKQEEVKQEVIKKEKAPEKKAAREIDSAQVIDSVENRLRNIASLTEQSDDDLKIVEERTGKFKLDFKKKDDSLIDEIDDNMSLDELMNLYEKKFKD